MGHTGRICSYIKAHFVSCASFVFRLYSFVFRLYSIDDRSVRHFGADLEFIISIPSMARQCRARASGSVENENENVHRGG